MTAIDVTAEHIASGLREHCTDCPVALAILAAFPGSEPVVIRTHVSFIGSPRWVDWADIELPDSAKRFIQDFDAGEPVRPFSFDLAWPAVTA